MLPRNCPFVSSSCEALAEVRVFARGGNSPFKNSLIQIVSIAPSDGEAICCLERGHSLVPFGSPLEELNTSN